jgi:sarcosine oxidase, subunit beta
LWPTASRKKQTLKTLLAKQKSLGLNIDWYDRDDLLEIVPTSTRSICWAAPIRPKTATARRCWRCTPITPRLPKPGPTFRYNEPVTGLVIQGGQDQGRQDPAGRIRADVVINASGAWARQIGLMAGLDLPVNPDCTRPASPSRLRLSSAQ